MSERRRRPNKVYKVEAVEAEAEAAAAETPETPPTDVLDDAAARQRRKEVPPKAEEEAVVEEAPKPAKPTMSSVDSGLPGVIPKAELAAITPAAREAAVQREVELSRLSEELSGWDAKIAEQTERRDNAAKKNDYTTRMNAEIMLGQLEGSRNEVQGRISKLRPVVSGRAPTVLGSTGSGASPRKWYDHGAPKPLAKGRSGQHVAPWGGTVAGPELTAPPLPPQADHAVALTRINDAIKNETQVLVDLTRDQSNQQRILDTKYGVDLPARTGASMPGGQERWEKAVTTKKIYQKGVEELDRQIEAQRELIEQMGRIRDVTLGAGNIRQAAANAAKK